MAQPTQSEQVSGLQVLEAQIRESFGRVVYSHKTHEKCADQFLRMLSRIKLAQIILAAITTGGLIVTIFGDPTTSKVSAILSAIFSATLLALNTYTKDIDHGKLAQQHKETADKLWNIRESYLSILTDIRAGGISAHAVKTRRDELQEKLAEVYNSAPRTTGKGYAEASRGLKERDELTFADAEIDKFLPAALRSRATSQDLNA